MRDLRERRWMARPFHAGVSVAAVAVLAVACRDAKPTESIRAIGAKPQNVCFVNPGGTTCSCDAIPGPPFWTGVWPDCTQVPSLFHIKIAVDSMTLALGDTTLFRVTAPGATTLQIQSYSFVPTGPVMAAVRARQQRGIGPRSPTAAAGTTVNPLSMTATFLLPRTAPSQRTVDRPGTPGRGVEGVTVVPPRRSHDSWGLDTLGDCTQGTLLPVCYYAPPQSGYMLVTGMVDGEQQRDSVSVQVIQHAATLTLTCSNPAGQSDSTTGGTTLVRGQSVTCRASPSEGTITVTEWSFLSTDGMLSRNRHETNPDFGPDSTVWAGPMIASGSVTVTAVLSNGLPSTKSAPVTVRPRDWSASSIPEWPATPTVVGQGWLPPQPGNEHELGQTRWRFHNNAVVDSTGSRGLVADGPNAFVFFVSKLPPLLDSLSIAINTSALTRGSTFWLLQPEYNSSVINLANAPCYRSDVTSQETLTKILGHEGSNWELNPVSHAGVLRQLTSAMVVPAAEGVFSKAETGTQGFRDRWMALIYPVEARVDTLAGKPVDNANPVHFGSGAQGNLGCHFTYTP